MEAYKREFIEFLQSAGVLKFGDFTAKSGRKIPYFVNAGMIKTGDQISKLGEFYAKAYFDKLGKKEAVLYGPLTKAFRFPFPQQFLFPKTALTFPSSSTEKKQKTTAKAALLLVTFPSPARKSSSSKTLSPQEPQSANPWKSSASSKTPKLSQPSSW